MELNTILDFLKKHEFKILYSHYSEGFFGNIVIEIEMDNNYFIKIVKDRSTYECYIEIHKWVLIKSIPIISVFKILKNESINVADTTFNSADEMLTYLVNHKQELNNLDVKIIKNIIKKWE